MNFDIKQYIHESNLIEEINDPEYDEQSLVAWNFIKGVEELNFDNICKVQKLNTLLQDDLRPHECGYTRSTAKITVWIGGKPAPVWWLVDGLLQNFILDMKEYWESLDPLKMHVRFEKIHPFADGNGRTGRMILWWHELKRDQKPTLFLNSEKNQKYYRLFD